jgi:hypothetical protein
MVEHVEYLDRIANGKKLLADQTLADPRLAKGPS